MHVLEVLVTRAPGETKLDNGWSIGPADANMPARVLTRMVKDGQFVGNTMIRELNSFGLSVYWRAEGLLVLEIHDRRSVRRVVRQAKRIIKAFED